MPLSCRIVSESLLFGCFFANQRGSHDTLLKNKKNSGFAKTVNVGMKAVKTGDIIVLNSDIEAKKYWLESLQYAAYTSDDIGIVGG